MITADQLVCHAVGDYILQSDWMASRKTKEHFAAACHTFTYALPFLALRPSWQAFCVIAVTHFLIDRYRLARFVVYAKNFLAPRDIMERVPVPSSEEAAAPGGMVTRLVIVPLWHPWQECSGTGYHKSRPDWMAVWLLIIADNVMHVLINGLALKYLA